ncbi:PREDICTED: protein scribble homolog isoform X12 [Cyprinodon variegatus]|uniref:protein scribble homolog isoform X12 n=1 Tax=Cyprinodon variegatus TaxID=28743 RepID=UPI000742B0E5|nr:PREDICTED: protein scribble homolog isoform X12 [Cyprinodon variegatus]
MEAPLPANHGALLEPAGFGLVKPTEPLTDHSYLKEFQFSHNGTPTINDSPGSATAVDSMPAVSPEEEEECLVDSQPMCFRENPFLVANRKGKGLPPGEQILSGPPVGYGQQGKLQPWLFSKTPSDYTRTDSPVREAPYSPTIQPPSHHSSNSSLCAGRETRFANIHYTATPTAKDSTSSSTRPGAIQPVGRVRPTTSPGTPERRSPNPFQHGPSPFNSQTSPRAPSPSSPDEFPMNVKQAYKAFAAVPRSLAVLEPPQDLYSGRNNFHMKQPSPEPVLNDEVFDDRIDGQEGGGEGLTRKVSPRPSLSSDRREYMSLAAVPCFSRSSMEMKIPLGGKNSPEQRSFRDRQKYFEIDVKQQTPEKPKPRISLVGEEDLKKMREEEERRFEQRAREYLMDEDEEDEEEEDLAKQVEHMKATGKVLLDGVEYKVEPVSSPSQHCSTQLSYCGSSGPSSVDGKGDSQRNSLEDSFRLEQRPNSMTGLISAYPGESTAPIRTAKAERRHQERLRMQSPELAVAPDKDLSPAEKRALEAEKRAMWRAARMKSLEQDALKAQMVIAKSRDGKKRGTLDQLAESPSPAPTPSPTPMEELSPRALTSPGRLTPDAAEEVQYIDASSIAGTEVEVPAPLPATSALEEMALYSNKRKLRQGRRSLETAMPT